MLAIAGMTGAVGVLVSPGSATTQRGARTDGAGEPTAPAPRPRLTTTSDVRTTALHRAHLEAVDRVDCTRCHDLRASEFLRPPVERCLGCHTGHEPAVHGRIPEAACLTCHDFLVAGDAKPRARPCESCHHQVAAHGAPAEMVSHRQQPCITCHPVHARQAGRPQCLDCHDTHATGHPAVAAGRTACLTCHQPHRPAREARAGCASCHVAGASDLPAAARIPPTALFAGHDRCVQCHAGHSFTRAMVKACRDCHPGKHVLSAEKVASHAACTSCHPPHAAQSPPAARCTACHAAIAASSKHPRDPRGRDCVGCHPPHQDLGPSRMVLACADRCHVDKRDAGHGSLRCTACHARHRFRPEKTAPALCLDCHAQAIGGAPAIAAAAGHARCTNCHQTAAHRPAAARPACGSCHQAEASTAPTGHAECKKCHDVHAGTRRPEAARCESCHADRARTPHVRIPGGCQACHRPHGPGGPATRPTCAQCHAPGGLAGLHASPSHRNCGACHLAHAPSITGREPCLRCHTDRRDHLPAARLCQACHPFGAGPR